MEKTKNGITEGVIWKQLLLFFFPILIGTFFQQLYNTVDTNETPSWSRSKNDRAFSSSISSLLKYSLVVVPFGLLPPAPLMSTSHGPNFSSTTSCAFFRLFVFRRKHECAVRAFRRADLHVIHQAVRAGFRGRSRLFSSQNFRYCCGFRQFFLAEVLLKTVKYAILFYTFPRYT